jgi:hypothetical protein
MVNRNIVHPSSGQSWFQISISCADLGEGPFMYAEKLASLFCGYLAIIHNTPSDQQIHQARRAASKGIMRSQLSSVPQERGLVSSIRSPPFKIHIPSHEVVACSGLIVQVKAEPVEPSVATNDRFTKTTTLIPRYLLCTLVRSMHMIISKKGQQSSSCQGD